ncbi:receptor-type tyrosine-protein phosphatase alpha-like [Mya arenaria]|uniref:receptor-type tyrosine-protein phosphatase alpha-like n=1 Tax=Mya arenaria TaxID=6604 RepID=UPI0022E7D5AE|nr:receptor-type tyrosine-protein phosphatase alpha-like [Mya arenaria]
MACVSSVGQVERVVSGIHLTVVGPIKYNENRNVSVNDSLFLHEGGDLTVNCAANGSRYKGDEKNETERYEKSPSQNKDQQNAYSEIGAIESAFVSKDSTKAKCLNNDFEEKDETQVDKAYYSFDMHDLIPRTAIKIDHLYDKVLSTSYSEEMEIQFKNFPKGLTNDYNEALSIQNRPKNRYKNIYPYDATRVILQKDEQHSTNYINASFIHGYSLAKEFVAAQGPTDEILVDFWRMVWQLRVGKIVMLTNLEEDKKMKCVQYWPGEGSIEYDSFKITHRSAELFSDFVIRKLALQKDGEEERIVYHFQFTAWPDKSVPKYASSLVHFRQKIVTTAVKDKGPIIVHCSAGVGRTGTFIALNVLTEQTSTVGYVDPVGCVNSLRRQRLDMVQTSEQYIFLHMALLETLMLSTSDLPASKFMKAYEELLVFDKHRRKLDVEFSRLEKMSPVADECQNVSAKEMRNKNKNRYSNILPVADNMPYLTPSGNRSDPDYINAVFLPNYKKKRAFIVTQTPLEATKTDFWRLVVEHDVHTIVMINNRSEMKEDEIYWPENEESKTYENMTITKTGEESERGLRIIRLDLNRFGKTRKLQQIQFEGWPDDSTLPSSPKGFINLLDAVQYWQHQSGNNPVLVHCMNGSESGLFCVVSAVLERMKIEQDVAITQVIKEMRNYREQVIPSVDQFKFVHEVVKEYILQNETYSNFAARC